MVKVSFPLYFLIFLTPALLAASVPAESRLKPNYANLPINFEANIGQADSTARFVAHAQDGNLLFTANEAWLMLPNHRSNESRVLRLKLAGANPNPALEGIEKLPGMANYFTGNDPGLWRTNAATFAKVKYHSVYPGVDLIYYGSQQKLEYDFVVQPGADPKVIALDFTDAENITLDARGDLLLRLNGETIRQHRPVVYQVINGTRKMLLGDYVLHSAMQVGFQIADYDKTQPLVIDPVLGFSATIGSSAASQANGIAVDFQNNVYVTGVTSAKDFPTLSPFQNAKPGSQAAFIVKFDTNNTIVYSTYLGGGVTNDMTTTVTSALGIAVDSNGDAFVTGFTTTTNFPIKNPIQATKGATPFNSRNAFVTELNPAGNALVYSTYLGGSGSDTATGIAIDTNGSAIITGEVTSTNFPTSHALQTTNHGSSDAFVAKLSPDGSTLVYSTYLGGSSAENQDLSATGQPPLGAVAVDLDGNAYVTGTTYSTNFPVLHAFQSTNQTLSAGTYNAAYVTKLDPFGNLVYSTYFAGMQGDMGRAIGVDFRQNVYFAGNSRIGDLPITNAFQANYGGRGPTTGGIVGDGFIAALDSTGTNLIYCTYLGGSGDDQINGLTVRATDGSVAVAGFTDSPNLPVSNAVQPHGFQGLLTSSNGGASWNAGNNGITSGVIYSLQIDPSNPAILYVLTSAGCFKSTDSGAHWTAANNGLVIFFSPPIFGGGSAGLFGIDPLHPATLYAGTFEGVYKTTNGAATWVPANTGMPTFADVQVMAIDPTTPTTLYAGTQGNGVYKTIDGGNSWTAVNNGISILSILSLLVDPNNSSNVYAGAENFSSSRQLFKSTDGGGSWTLLNGGIKGGDVDFLAAGPGNPATIYTVIGDTTGFPVTPILYSSTNGGTTWTSLLQGSGFTFTALTVGPPALPSLSIANSGGNDLISWPSSFSSFVLQSTPTLMPTNWQNVALSRTTNNGVITVSVPKSGNTGFYRLVLSNPPAGRPAVALDGGVSSLASPLDTSAASLPPTLFLGTDPTSGEGIFVCTDGGHDWTSVGPNGCGVSDIKTKLKDPTFLYSLLSIGRDGMVATVSPDGHLETCTYTGGAALDQCTAIASDNATTVYPVGNTLSSDFVTTTTPPVIQTPPTIIDSVTQENFADAFFQAIESEWECPHNSTEPPQTFHNGKGYLNIDFVNFFAKPTPRGVPIGLTFMDQASVIYLKGTTTPGSYDFSVDYQETAPNGLKCMWTVSYTIVVLP